MFTTMRARLRTRSLLTGCLVLFAAINPVFSQTWIPTTQTGDWYAIAASADGSRLVVAGSSGIYTSVDFGVNWTQQTNAPALVWFSVASSANGEKLAAGSESGPIYTSTNGGVSWVATSSPDTFWTSIASSADGVKLVAEQGHPGMGPIYTSKDSGMTWSSNNVPSLLWEGVASSADGTKLVAVATTGQIYTSTDSGADWLLRIANGLFWTSVASSTNGTKLVAACDNGGIYTSTNSGVNWHITKAVTNYWDSVASSADGTKLVAVGDGSIGSGCPVLTSTNSGNTWMTNTAPKSYYWPAVTSSADGNTMAAASYGDDIYIMLNPTSPILNVAFISPKFNFTWFTSATNFVLQQCLNLKTPAWVTLTNKPTHNAATLQNQVILSTAKASGFYRLTIP